MKKSPSKVNILGVNYTVKYYNKVSEVDKDKHESLHGQIWYADKEIRIYKGNRTYKETLQTLLHEIMHGIDVYLHINMFGDNINHKNMDMMIKILSDTMIRNNII
jgi:hypothetical protein